MSVEIAELTFEEAMNELESVLEQLETRELTLEESIRLYERGQQLAARCNTQLEEAGLRVEQLTADGEIVEVSAS